MNVKIKMMPFSFLYLLYNMLIYITIYRCQCGKIFPVIIGFRECPRWETRSTDPILWPATREQIRFRNHLPEPFHVPLVPSQSRHLSKPALGERGKNGFLVGLDFQEIDNLIRKLEKV